MAFKENFAFGVGTASRLKGRGTKTEKVLRIGMSLLTTTLWFLMATTPILLATIITVTKKILH